MKNSRCNIYIQPSESEPIRKDVHADYLDADVEENWKKFDRYVKAKEDERRSEMKRNIYYFRNELFDYSRMIAEEMKTKEQAENLKRLILDRLFVFKQFAKIGNENQQAYNELIEDAKILIERIDAETRFNSNFGLPLTRFLENRELSFLYQELTEKNFIKCRWSDFNAVFGGEKNEDFRKIKWLPKNKQALKNLLVELKHDNTSKATIVKIAGNFFEDENGVSIDLPKKDKRHNSADEAGMDEIISDFRILCEKMATH